MFYNIAGSGSICFKLYWKGSYGFDDVNFSVVEVMVSDTDRKIYAKINHSRPINRLQKLTFKKDENQIVANIHQPLTVKFSVRQDNENHSLNVQLPNAELQARAILDDLQIAFETSPQFKGGKKYRVKILHKGNGALTGTVEERNIRESMKEVYRLRGILQKANAEFEARKLNLHPPPNLSAANKLIYLAREELAATEAFIETIEKVLEQK